MDAVPNVVESKVAKGSTSSDEITTTFTAENEECLTPLCILKSTSKDYGSLLKVNTSKQVEELEQLIDGLLAKLEEYCTIIESIRYESKDALFTTIPVLHERCQQLKPVFQQIDQLESFISVVQECVNDADMKVTLAEKELGNKNLKKILRSVPVPRFLSGKKEFQPYLKQDVHPYDFKAPVTFKTDDYFQQIHLLKDDIDDAEDYTDE